MRWVSLVIAGTSLLALPHLPVSAPAVVSRFAVGATSPEPQTAVPDGNLPASRYLELRTQTLARSRLIAGPRLKNPNLVSGGLERSVATALAEQRASRLGRIGFVSQTSAGPLLNDRPVTLLSSLPSNQPARQIGIPVQTELASRKSSCSVPAIHDVNGRASGPVFTPAEPDSHYRISGCGFGSAAGTVRLQPSVPVSGTPIQPIALQLETLRSWNDDHIDVRINPGLNGVPDFTADLVVQLPNGHIVQLSHCQFVATRGEPQLLRSIPAAWVRLDATSLSARAIHQVELESPPVEGAEVPHDAVGSTAFTVRSNLQPFSAGRDNYDFSQLAPGWVIESVQLRVFNATCPGESKLPVSNGSWETSWTAHGFVVAWVDETCSTYIPPAFNFTLSSSQYATNVWVIGPVGTQPFANGINVRQP